MVGDEETAIVDALNALRHRYTYVFTTGGIGPAPDDITSGCVAKAFGVPIDVDPRALAILHEWLKATGAEMSEARMRMTASQGRRSRPQRGVGRARLLDRQRDRAGWRAFDHAGNARPGGAQAQDRHPPALGNCPRRCARERYRYPARRDRQGQGVAIGSHPFFDPQHGPNTNVVLRASDAQKLQRAKRAVEDMLQRVQGAQSSRD